MKKICSLLVSNMAVLVILAGVFGVFFPETLTWAKPYIGWMLGVVMFGMGMTLTVDDFKAVFSRPLDVAIGVIAQFAIMPLAAYFLVWVFQLPPDLAIGVILLGTCPGGTASNVIAYLARGDVALSVSISMATTILAPFVTPALTLLLADARIEVSAAAMMISIAEMVLLPILLGVAAHHYFERSVNRVLPAMPVISVLMIVLLVAVVVSLSGPSLMTIGPVMAVIVVLHNLFGLTLGYGLAHLCGMNSKKARTVAIEVGIQNSGMAASLSVMYFTPAAAIPAAIFSVWHNISGSLFANYFQHYDAKKENRLSQKEKAGAAVEMKS